MASGCSEGVKFTTVSQYFVWATIDMRDHVSGFI